MRSPRVERAEALAEKLAASLETNLISLLLYGNHARGGYGVEHTDVSLLLLVRDASTAALRPLETTIAEWVRDGQESPPLIMSESEWHSSADVFPIEIEDMREAHRLFKGIDPFASITTNRHDLRQELERELRGKLLHLRAEYAAAAPDGKALTRLLLDSIHTFFVLMRALVRLVGGTPQAAPNELVEQACRELQLDPSAFQWVVEKMSGETVAVLNAYDPIGAAYVDQIERMAHFVDGYQVS